MAGSTIGGQVRIWTVLCILLLAGSGCVSPNFNVDLGYRARSAGQSPHAMGTVYVARPDVSALRVDENGRTIVGGSYRTERFAVEGRERGKAFATIPVDEWLATAVKLELEQIGFTVHLTETLPKKVVHGLEVSAVKIHARGFAPLGPVRAADMELLFTVVRTGQDGSTFSVNTKYRDDNGRRGAVGFAQALEGALQGCLQKAMPKLARELTK